MAVNPADLPRIILERIETSFPAPAIFDADEISEWPDTALPALAANGLLQEVQRADTVICDGCEQRCDKSPIVRTTQKTNETRAFIVCDEASDLGRIGVPLARLRRYDSTWAKIATFLAHALSIAERPKSQQTDVIRLGPVKGRHGYRETSLVLKDSRLMLSAGFHQERLTEILRWGDGGMQVDRRAVQRLVNRKQTAKTSAARYQPSREKQQTKNRRTASQDRTILREALRLRNETGERWTAIAQRIAGMPFIRVRPGRQGTLTAATIRRIIHKLRQN